jgi:flagellar hook-basal body complex protein FliE
MEPLSLSLKSLETPKLEGSIQFNEKPSGVKSFSETLGDAMDNLKDLHIEANSLVQKYSSGEEVDVGEVMMAMEKSSMATELALQLRNKFIEGYQEIIRMQI